MKNYLFGKFILDIPDDHKIVEIHCVHVLYDRAFGFIIEEIGKASPGGVFVDIGANVGDTAAVFASYSSNPILCIEGNVEFLNYLKSNLRHIGAQVHVLEKFVRTLDLEKLKIRYQHGSGTGAMSVGNGGGQVVDSRDFVTVPDIAKKAKKLGHDIALFKSDTDGMDGYIISDALELIDAPLFFECDTISILSELKNPWPKVFRELSERDYKIIVFDNHGLPMLIEEDDPEQKLLDLAGYIHLQHAVQPVRVHYLDIWAFPRRWDEVFQRISNLLRSRLLKPFSF